MSIELLAQLKYEVCASREGGVRADGVRQDGTADQIWNAEDIEWYKASDVEKAMKNDYKKMLKAYIEHVLAYEGSTFIEYIGGIEELSEEENAELLTMSKEAYEGYLGVGRRGGEE